VRDLHVVEHDALEVTHRFGRALPDTPAVYLIRSPSGKGYVGQALNLRGRMQTRAPCSCGGHIRGGEAGLGFGVPQGW